MCVWGVLVLRWGLPACLTVGMLQARKPGTRPKRRSDDVDANLNLEVEVMYSTERVHVFCSA